jgi:hypothetical protein
MLVTVHSNVPLESVVEILRAFDDEQSSIVWSAISGVLNGLYLLMEQKYAGEAVFDAFVSFSKKLVVKALQHVGWDSKPTESHTGKQHCIQYNKLTQSILL